MQEDIKIPSKENSTSIAKPPYLNKYKLGQYQGCDWLHRFYFWSGITQRLSSKQIVI